MRLTDNEIQDALGTGGLVINPLPKNIAGITADLTLGNSFRWMLDCTPVGQFHEDPMVAASEYLANHERSAITVGESTEEKIYSSAITAADGEYVTIEPGGFMLGVTAERVAIPDNMVGWVDGRSSLARLGLFVHVTAGRIDPGWDGNIVLEFYNAGTRPIRLKPGVGIASISFERLAANVGKPYRLRDDAKYRNQTTAVGSRSSED